MSYLDSEAERTALATLFEQGWVSAPATPRTPIEWPNREFTTPVDGNGKPQPWVRFSLLPGEGRAASLGGNHKRYVGLVVIQLFVPLGEGEKVSRQLADYAAAIFENVDVAIGTTGRLVCRTPTLRTIGKSGTWYQQNVEVPYYRDSIS